MPRNQVRKIIAGAVVAGVLGVAPIGAGSPRRAEAIDVNAVLQNGLTATTSNVAPLFTGQVINANGLGVAGARIDVSNDPVMASASVPTLVASLLTDSNGRYSVRVEPTPEMVFTAAAYDGVVHLNISATKDNLRINTVEPYKLLPEGTPGNRLKSLDLRRGELLVLAPETAEPITAAQLESEYARSPYPIPACYWRDVAVGTARGPVYELHTTARHAYSRGTYREDGKSTAAIVYDYTDGTFGFGGSSTVTAADGWSQSSTADPVDVRNIGYQGKWFGRTKGFIFEYAKQAFVRQNGDVPGMQACGPETSNNEFTYRRVLRKIRTIDTGWGGTDLGRLHDGFCDHYPRTSRYSMSRNEKIRFYRGTGKTWQEGVSLPGLNASIRTDWADEVTLELKAGSNFSSGYAETCVPNGEDYIGLGESGTKRIFTGAYRVGPAPSADLRSVSRVASTMEFSIPTNSTSFALGVLSPGEKYISYSAADKPPSVGELGIER